MQSFLPFGLFLFLLLLTNIQLNEAGEPVTTAITVFQIFQFLKERIGEYNDIKEYFEANEEKNDKTLLDIKEIVTKLREEIHGIKYSIENKYFNSQIKYPTKKVFYQIHKFIEVPSNNTKHSLQYQCILHPPLSTLEALYDCLEDNWLIKVARHYDYKSDKVEALILILDKYITALIISQAACSGLSSSKEEARYDFKRLQIMFQRVSSSYNRSMAVIHKQYFQHTKKIIPNFLPSEISSSLFINDCRRKENYHLASKILHYFEKHYNYGVRYSVRVGQEDYREFYGTQNESFYQVSHGGFKVFVMQIAPFNAEYNDLINETKKQINAINEIQLICCQKDILYIKRALQRVCPENVACFFAFIPNRHGCYKLSSRNTDIQAANGFFIFWIKDTDRFCAEYEYFISPAVLSNHNFKPLPIDHHNFLNIDESQFDLTWIDAKLNAIKQKEWSEKSPDNRTLLFLETGMSLNVDHFLVDIN